MAQDRNAPRFGYGMELVHNVSLLMSLSRRAKRGCFVAVRASELTPPPVPINCCKDGHRVETHRFPG
jgi:hypothetical protein